MIKQIKPELLISVGFLFILPPEVLKIPRFSINVHPTLLPKYRGKAAGYYIIRKGERETGVTVHHIDEEVDSGDIIFQERISLDKFDTMKSIMRKTDLVEADLLCRAVIHLKNNTAPRIKQDESQATIFQQNRTPEDSMIDWNLPLRDLYNKIRACDSERFPAFFYVDGEKVCLQMWRQEKLEDEYDRI